MFSGTAADGAESSGKHADEGVGLFGGVSVACGNLLSSWRLLRSGVEGETSDSASDDSDSVSEPTDWLDEAYKQ